MTAFGIRQNIDKMVAGQPLGRIGKAGTYHLGLVDWVITNVCQQH